MTALDEHTYHDFISPMGPSQFWTTVNLPQVPRPARALGSQDPQQTTKTSIAGEQNGNDMHIETQNESNRWKSDWTPLK
jgi:hypothetical protein